MRPQGNDTAKGNRVINLAIKNGEKYNKNS